MSRAYTVPRQTQKLEQRRAIGIGLGFLLGMSVVFGLIALLFRPHLSAFTPNDLVVFPATLILPCAALWLRARSLRSLCIELEDDRISRTEIPPLRRAPQRISFTRSNIARITELPKQGLMVHGKNSGGRYVNLEIPRSLENYDDLRSRLASWHPIHEGWF